MRYVRLPGRAFWGIIVVAAVRGEERRGSEAVKSLETREVLVSIDSCTVSVNVRRDRVANGRSDGRKIEVGVVVGEYQIQGPLDGSRQHPIATPLRVFLKLSRGT